MGLLNLALGQLLGLALPVAGLLVALYFYDRSRRSVLVSTLRFWPLRPAPPVRQRHKRIQHPLSLALQLAAMILLLLAIADPRADDGSGEARHRVLMLDTSGVMALPDADGNTLMDEAKRLALAYVDRLAPGDPLLLVEADGSPFVRVPFTTDRQRVRDAIAAAKPGWTGLDLEAAFGLADGSLRLALNSGGAPVDGNSSRAEAVYVGPGRYSGRSAGEGSVPALRVLETAQPQDALGVSGLRAAADGVEDGKWSVELDARNFSGAPVTTRAEFLFEDKPLGFRDLRIPAAGEASLNFTLRTRRPGRLQAQLLHEDAYPANNGAVVSIPASRRTPLQVVGASQQEFAQLLAPGARVEASFVESVDELLGHAIHVWARGGQPGLSRRGIYLTPPGVDSPVPGAVSVQAAAISEWSPSHPVARGVRDPDLRPVQARVFEPAGGDEVVAGCRAGPVIVARDTGDERLVAFGFDLSDDSVRGHLAAPLLFANAVSWLDAAAFRAQLSEARAPGSVSVDAPNSVPEQVVVRGPGRNRVPWVMEGGTVRFYASQPGAYRVLTADRDVTLHLTQRDLPAQAWDLPEAAARGLPPVLVGVRADWLAVAGCRRCADPAR